MRTFLFGCLLLLRFSSSAETPCALQIGNMQFAQPDGSAEAYTGSNGDTTWRVRYEIPASGKAGLLEAIFGAMHFHCNGGMTKVRSFSLRVVAEDVKLPYVKHFQTNYIVRDEDLEDLFSRKQFVIYIDNIQVFGSGHTVYGLAIEYKE